MLFELYTDAWFGLHFNCSISTTVYVFLYCPSPIKSLYYWIHRLISIYINILFGPEVVALLPQRPVDLLPVYLNCECTLSLLKFANLFHETQSKLIIRSKLDVFLWLLDVLRVAKVAKGYCIMRWNQRTWKLWILLLSLSANNLITQEILHGSHMQLVTLKRLDRQKLCFCAVWKVRNRYWNMDHVQQFRSP